MRPRVAWHWMQVRRQRPVSETVCCPGGMRKRDLRGSHFSS